MTSNKIALLCLPFALALLVLLSGHSITATSILQLEKVYLKTKKMAEN